MNLCNEGHEEVCFEGRNCPACTAITELQSIIDGLNDDVQGLEEKIKDLEAEIETGEV